MSLSPLQTPEPESIIETASLWGQAYEIAVKRGILTAMLGAGLPVVRLTQREDWESRCTIDVYDALRRELGHSDPNAKRLTGHSAKHLFIMGMGQGQTALREYVRRLKGSPEDYTVEALWCPLQLPRAHGDFQRETQAALQQFHETFALEGRRDTHLARAGFPSQADFVLWLKSRYSSIPDELLCVEFSYNHSPSASNFLLGQTHLEEMRRYAWMTDARGVFSRVCAEVSGEHFMLGEDLEQFLPAFTGRDKPLYKLCQAASYTSTLVDLLRMHDRVNHPLTARALSITPNGQDSIAAHYPTASGPSKPDARVHLMSSMGAAYRKAAAIPKEPTPEELTGFIRYAFDRLRKALPRALSQQLKSLTSETKPGQNLAVDLSEEITGFCNPMDTFSEAQVMAMVGDDPAAQAYFGQSPATAIRSALLKRQNSLERITLRDLHAATIDAALCTLEKGQLAVLALEGNPGIGKTTAVVSNLTRANQGFLFLYVSPRVIINDDVTLSLARDRATGQPSGVLTLTTNSRMIAAANDWSRAQAHSGSGNPAAPSRFVDSAVIADGVAALQQPHDSPTLYLSPAQREELEKMHLGRSQRRRSVSEREDQMVNRVHPGVLRVLSSSARDLLECNPQVNQVVLTAAIQGYREFPEGGSTISGLSNLFQGGAETKMGRSSRARFADRIPTVVVMVDELTGDRAGASLLKAITRWLHEEFIEPFKDEPRFKVALIVSDASLCNEVVLERYLGSGERAPDKVLISPSQGISPFRLAVTPFQLLRTKDSSCSVLHVMTNSFPASRLVADYRLRLDCVRPEMGANDLEQTPRQAIQAAQRTILSDNVCQEIRREILAGAQQVIFFAQDKGFLRSIQARLRDELPGQSIEILDASVLGTERKRLVSDAHRDDVKCFLMTSSAARGVSFPKCDRIIALLPRFGVESSLMEIAQLIYRGRGNHYRADDGSTGNGDTQTRKLIMLLQDFTVTDKVPDPLNDERQWLRQVSDLLTYFMLLRGTIHTRITGDAGLEKTRLAIVPVGGIGTEDMLSLMSTQVRAFMRESAVFLQETPSERDEMGGLLEQARNNVEALFPRLTLKAIRKLAGGASISRPHELQAFCTEASGPQAPLLIDPTLSPAVRLPDNVYCTGPFWLEHWDNHTIQERFTFKDWHAPTVARAVRLTAQLRRIAMDQRLPDPVRRPAEDLAEILDREHRSLEEAGDRARREQTTYKDMRTALWLAFPLDYLRFWDSVNERPRGPMGDGTLWRDALGRGLPGAGDIMPVIPVYEQFPFAAAAGIQDPARFEQIYDNRYFAASNELNLLNSLLLPATCEPPSEAGDA